MPDPVPLALDLAAGPSLVLDDRLRVVLASPSAEALLGRAIASGASAVAMLCGDRPKRPVAEALAAGLGTQAVIPRPGDHTRLLNVRSVALGTGKRPAGWLLFLTDAGTAEGVELFHGMVARNSEMKQVFRQIERVALEDVTVLIRGESGSGKELVAQAIHDTSGRKGRFLAINCAALPPALLEAELFGAVRGAYTGAHKDTPGIVRSADKGTLLLDEVAELPLELQAKLLRFLETREVLPVGGSDPVAVDVRVISATHRALRQEVEAGRFRADLMYRLRVIPIFVPPLRERPDDIPLLTHRLVEELNVKSARRHIDSVSPAAMAVLVARDWPGNVRELRNALQYAFALGDGPVLRRTDLPRELLEPNLDGARDPSDTSDPSVGPGAVEHALRDAGGNRQAAAAALGVSRVTLWRWMRDADTTADRPTRALVKAARPRSARTRR